MNRNEQEQGLLTRNSMQISFRPFLLLETGQNQQKPVTFLNQAHEVCKPQIIIYGYT
jgi:hypothetical protein